MLRTNLLPAPDVLAVKQGSCAPSVSGPTMVCSPVSTKTSGSSANRLSDFNVASARTRRSRYMDHIMGPTRFFLQDPWPLGLPEILAVSAEAEAADLRVLGFQPRLEVQLQRYP